MASAAQLRKRLIDYALGLPEARLDHPWGEDVVKVRKKVVVFFGMPDSDDPGMSLKLPGSQALALAQPGVSATGYGLGDSGWVSVRLAQCPLPYELLASWIDESFRAVAPKKLVVPRS